MARVNKKQVKKVVKPKVVKNPSGIKEESEKGELFFKIVLLIMAVALVSVVLYFVVDALIGKDNNAAQKRYETNNYVLLDDVKKVSNRENFENLTHEGLKQTLDSYEFVYIFFYSESNPTTWQEAAASVVDNLFDLESVEEKESKGFKYYVLSPEHAMFFVDIDVEANTGWQDVIETGIGQAARNEVPALLEVVNGEDLNWFGPFYAADKNVSAETKLTELLNSFN